MKDNSLKSSKVVVVGFTWDFICFWIGPKPNSICPSQFMGICLWNVVIVNKENTWFYWSSPDCKQICRHLITLVFLKNSIVISIGGNLFFSFSFGFCVVVKCQAFVLEKKPLNFYETNKEQLKLGALNLFILV